MSHKLVLGKIILFLWEKKLVFFWQESDIHEILLIRILNLGRRPTVLSWNGYHLGRTINRFLAKVFCSCGKNHYSSKKNHTYTRFFLYEFLTLGEDPQFFFSRARSLLLRIIILLWGRRIWNDKFFSEETWIFQREFNC